MSKEQKKFSLIKKKNYKTLYSAFQTPPKKPFFSIFDCKPKNYKEEMDINVININSYGLMIRTHRENKEKFQIIKEKHKIIINDYFEKHKNCKETEYYWKDILHPKILKHYSKIKNKPKFDLYSKS